MQSHIEQNIMRDYFPRLCNCWRVTPVHRSGSGAGRNNYKPISMLLWSVNCWNFIPITMPSVPSYQGTYYARNNLHGFWRCYTSGGVVDPQQECAAEWNSACWFNIEYHFDESSIGWVQSRLTGAVSVYKSGDVHQGMLSLCVMVSHKVKFLKLLFILFVNDLPHTIHKRDLHADDHTLNSSGNSFDECITSISSALEDVPCYCIWMVDSG